MTKAQAVSLFGNVTKLCKAMGISRNAYYKWDDPLKQRKADQVRGAWERVTEARDKEAVILFRQKKELEDNTTSS